MNGNVVPLFESSSLDAHDSRSLDEKIKDEIIRTIEVNLQSNSSRDRVLLETVEGVRGLLNLL